MIRFRKITRMRAERWDLRPLVVILVMLISGVFIKTDKAWLAIVVAAALCLFLATMRRGPQ
jgi:hypothetical protein